MVTVRPTSSLPRSRPMSAGPLRLLWLGLLLLGLLYTHGLSGESAAGHMTTVIPAATAAVASADGEAATHAEATHGDPEDLPGPGHHHDGGGHTAHSCLAGNPQHGADFPAPCVAPLQGVAPTLVVAVTVTRPAETGPAPGPPGNTAILRI